MKLRTQLLLAFFALSVVPLAVLVLFSYSSSQKAFRQAVEAEALVLADEMSERMAVTKEDLQRAVVSLGRLALGEQPGGSMPLSEQMELERELSRQLGSAVTLVDKLELSARPPTPPGAGPGSGPHERLEVVWMPEPGSRPVRLPLDGLAAGEEASIEEVLEAARQALRKLDGARLEQISGGGGGGEVLAPPREVGPPPGASLVARIRGEELVREVLARTPRDRGEVPFAFDVRGQLFTENRGDREQLQDLPPELLEVGAEDPQISAAAGWVVAKRREPGSDITFGVARPVRDSLDQIRQAAVRNLVYGLALIALALLGILPFSAHLTRHLSTLSRGAERIAAGDLQARVPVRSENEIGQLARSFNHMAFQLSENQRQLLAQERQRQEQELQRQLLEAENSRKSRELEEARRFQLALLPKELPRPPGLELAVYTRTATEVGGDYYDFLWSGGRALTAAIGDATGHGARAGTLVAVIKSLFATRAPGLALPEFLDQASRTIKGMGLQRMAMALTVLRFEDHHLELSAAGMPPPLLYRAATGEAEEIELPGMPLGGLLEFPYRRYETSLAAGDTLLLMTDGLPELLDSRDRAFGYDRVRSTFLSVARLPPAELIDELTRAADTWRAGRSLEDDMTFVVFQVAGA